MEHNCKSSNWQRVNVSEYIDIDRLIYRKNTAIFSAWWILSHPVRKSQRCINIIIMRRAVSILCHSANSILKSILYTGRRGTRKLGWCLCPYTNITPIDEDELTMEHSTSNINYQICNIALQWSVLGLYCIGKFKLLARIKSNLRALSQSSALSRYWPPLV